MVGVGLGVGISDLLVRGLGGLGEIIDMGSLLNVQVFTASGTYTPTAGTNKILVSIMGGGGGGGGCAAAPTGNTAIGRGGGAGGYEEAFLDAPSTTAEITIGAAGAAGAAGAGGGAGGTSSYVDGETTVQATGGAGGVTIAPTNIMYLDSVTGGGVGSGGYLNARGNRSVAGLLGDNRPTGGTGASTPWGAGGTGAFSAGAASNVGGNAIGFGAGGGGASAGSSSSTARAGGDATPGKIVIFEFS